MEMGERIKDLRLKNKMSQEELGLKLGLQKSAIAKYESGRVENMKRSIIQKMASIFGVSPGYLMGWEETTNKNYLKSVTNDENIVEISNKTSLSDKEERLLAFFRLFNSRGQERALETLEEFTLIGLYTEVTK